MITAATVGVTVKFYGLYAEPAIWRALGLSVSLVSNTAEGEVGYTYSRSDVRRGDVVRWIETARDQLGDGVTDERVLRRAIALRNDYELARAGAHVEGRVEHAHAHVHRAPQLDHLLSAGGDAE